MFIPSTTYEKTSFTEKAGRSYTNGFSGPKCFRDVRETRLSLPKKRSISSRLGGLVVGYMRGNRSTNSGVQCFYPNSGKQHSFFPLKFRNCLVSQALRF